MTIRYVTFSIGGALKGYYAEFVAGEDVDVEKLLRKYCSTHFPKDWSFTYSQQEFENQAEKHGLTKLGTYLWQHDDFCVVACRRCGNPRCRETHDDRSLIF